LTAAAARLATLVRPPGVRVAGTVDAGPRSVFIATAVFTALAVVSVALGYVMGRPVAALGLVPILLMPALARRPVAAGVALACGGAVFRIALVGTGVPTDQIETTQAALRVVLAGDSPYGAAIPGTSTMSPFPYGPLALVAYIPGLWTEVIAGILTMLLLARERVPVAVAFYAAFPLIVRGTVMGTNDVLPGLLITVAVLLIASRPVWAGVVLAAAGAIKPYALAWAPGLFGAGGVSAAAAFLLVSLLAWSPLLFWGPVAYLRSLALAEAVHPIPAGGTDLRGARIVALPLSVIAFARARSFDALVVSGTLVFCAVMLLGHWFSYTYVLAPLPLVLIVAERWVRARLSPTERAASTTAPVPAR
jgi:hypothetical protein